MRNYYDSMLNSCCGIYHGLPVPCRLLDRIFLKSISLYQIVEPVAAGWHRKKHTGNSSLPSQRLDGRNGPLLGSRSLQNGIKEIFHKFKFLVLIFRYGTSDVQLAPFQTNGVMRVKIAKAIQFVCQGIGMHIECRHCNLNNSVIFL